MPSRNINGWYGWRPDKPDVRDKCYQLPRFNRIMALALPKAVDLRPDFPPCYDQGQLGSCTANAIAGALEYDQRKQKLPEFTPSRLFIYYNERVMEGTVLSDAGAEIRDGVKSVNQQGAPSEATWKYVETKFTSKPTKKAYTEAKKHCCVVYERVQQTVDALRTVLTENFPVVFGFTCYESFESDEVAKTGVLNMPAASEKVVGGHAVLIVGYDSDSSRFIVRNSWGTDWGQNGFFTIPYEYVTNPNLADDFWVLRTTK